MLLAHRDAYGNLEAVLDYQVVDAQGQITPDGQYIWVEQLEVNRMLNATGYIQGFIQALATLYPLAKGAYWVRRDKLKLKQKLHAFTRWQLLKEVRV